MAAAANKSSRPCILGMGTANPSKVIWMKDFAKSYGQAIGVSADVQLIADRICQSTGITRKHLAVTYDQYAQNNNLKTFGAPSLDDRFALFESEAIPLAQEAADKAIQEWGVDRSAITHVITFSTNGMPSPGIDMQLIKALKLDRTTKHFTVSFMGCHAGLIGIRTAAEIALADPSHRVLVVCVELNSCQAQPIDPNDIANNLVVASIFGDGAAAVVIGAKPTEAEKPIYELHRSNTSFIPQSDTAIIARLTQSGLNAALSKRVPQYVGENVAGFVHEILEGTGLNFDTINWALHPGGKAIADTVEKNCKLRPEQLQVTRSIYNICEWTLALAFGPGISVEGTLMRMV